MRNVLLVFAVFLCSVLKAQNSELEAFKHLFNSEKQTALGEFLDLNATDVMNFWEIYDDYAVERKELGDRRVSLLKTYAAQYDTMTNENADKLVEESFAIRAKDEKIQKKYYKKVKKELGAKKAAQFLQFERYVQTAIDSELQEALPFIGER